MRLLDDWYINDDGGLEAMAHPAMIHQANYFTVNGKAFPVVAPIKLVQGETVRVRLAGRPPQQIRSDAHCRMVDIWAGNRKPLTTMGGCYHDDHHGSLPP